MSQKPLVLIPAAGFGRRMGSPLAKEMLSGPTGRPLIDTALDQARKRKWPVHVITREEKRPLIEYLQNQNDLQIEIQLIHPSQEWPDTLLKSQPYWRERNLLCLPDTTFSPTTVWDDLVRSHAPVSIATFEAEDSGKWGVVRKSSQGNLQICEKPTTKEPSFRAWGLISFHSSKGEEIFKAQLQSTFDHQWKEINVEAEFFPLEFFKDLTRNPEEIKS